MPLNLIENHTLSFNLTSLFRYPARFLRLNNFDSLLDDVIAEPTEELEVIPPPPEPVEQLLGPIISPWAFFTSRYMLLLLGLALLMYRIPNIVVPPRMPDTPRHPSRNSPFRRFIDNILPLDMSRTTTRFALHLPTLYFLIRILLLWCILVLQTSNLYPSHESGVIFELGKWCETKTMKEINSATFSTISAAFCVEGLVQSLGGVGSAFGAHMHANTSPFNLVGYAFLLHIYSHPFTHVINPPNLPSRPDKHAAITITIPLIQLTLLHILCVRKRWSNHRLLPTAFSSFLSLLHFHSTLLSHSKILPDYVQSIINTASNGTDSAGSLYSSPAGTVTYPLLNYLPNVLETILITIVVLTIFLNCLSQLLLTGSVERPLFGLGLTAADGSMVGTWSWSPPYDEDFGILLLRVGIASLEATGLRGWSNEAAAVLSPIGSNALIHQFAAPYSRYGPGPSGLYMDRGGVLSLGQNLRRDKVHVRRVPGLLNEIRDIHVTPDAGQEQRYYGIAGFHRIDLRWFRVLKTYFHTLWQVLLGSLLFAWEWVKGNRRRPFIHKEPRFVPAAATESQPIIPAPVANTDSYHQDLYGRFIRGEELSDDEHESEWGGSVSEHSSDSEDGDKLENDDEMEFERGTEALGLYTDLVDVRASTPDRVSSTTIVAHMTNTGSSPLTRRRYQALLNGGTPELPVAAEDRSVHQESVANEVSRNCVVCMVEARQIICWPCRCLTVCDECRANMASQYPTSKHRCPCCRKLVEGYSRIFNP